ncbi:YheU family protein [Marinobacter caseinilyticus]|uniref:YheU family protein n=1 Tax=Marinobacter caseinilyticus TaxID=2692195 RepID=UPI001409FA19|nr:YheU family protein [Marinobacter caseinilyticus]
MTTTDEASQQGQQDPREEPFEVDVELLTQDQLDGLIDEYCTRFHGLNESESPLAERGKVAAAIRRGELKVWFDPVENTAGLATGG